MWRRGLRRAAAPVMGAAPSASLATRLLARDLYRSLLRAVKEHDAKPELKAMLLGPSTRVFSGSAWKDRYDPTVDDAVQRAAAALKRRALNGRAMYVPGSGESWAQILRSERRAATLASAAASADERSALERRQMDLAFAVLRELADTKRAAADFTPKRDLPHAFARDYAFPAAAAAATITAAAKPVLFPARVTDLKAAAAAAATVVSSSGSGNGIVQPPSSSAAAVSGFEGVRPGCLLIAHPHVSVGESPRALSMTPAGYWSQSVILITHVEPHDPIAAPAMDRRTDVAPDAEVDIDLDTTDSGGARSAAASGRGVGVSTYGGGAVEGVIINKPAREAQVKVEAFRECVPFFGGPVGTHATSVLHGNGSLPGAVPIIPGVFVGAGSRALEESVKARHTDTRAIKLLAGRAEWAPGQLAGELALGWWLVASPYGLDAADAAVAPARDVSRSRRRVDAVADDARLGAAVELIAGLALSPPPKPLPLNAEGAAVAREVINPLLSPAAAVAGSTAGGSDSGKAADLKAETKQNAAVVNKANAAAMHWYSRAVWDAALNAMGGEYAAMTRLGTADAAAAKADADDGSASDSDDTRGGGGGGGGGGGPRVVMVSGDELAELLRRIGRK